jgi:serine-type D-Ala-D-Ala carboxypeptidase/endopeptidase (penicillin-binding protein 4)
MLRIMAWISILRLKLVFLALCMALFGETWAIAQEPTTWIVKTPSLAQAANASDQPLCPADFSAQVERLLGQPDWVRSHWGILVEGDDSKSDRASVYLAHNAQQYFIPASNAKLLLTAAALKRLGANFRIPTSVYRVKTPDSSTVLLIRGQGDPTLTDTQLQDLAQQLAQQGIRQIDQLIADDTVFQDSLLNGSWALEDLSGGNIVPISSIIVNRNAIPLQATPQALGDALELTWRSPEDARHWQLVNQTRTVRPDEPEFVEVQAQANQVTIKAALRVGSDPETIDLPVARPADYFLERFQKALTQQNISVLQRKVEKRGDLESTAIATVYSPPLKTIVAEINQHSDNLYAEALLRVLGTQYDTGSKTTLTATTLTTAEKGLAAIQNTLTQLGVDPNTYQLVDASGLSRQNLISPQALVQVLRAIAQTPEAQIFQDSLAQAGKSGTLASRFTGTPAVGKVWGKTGTLSNISALSGLVHSADGSPIFFSIIVNQSEQSNIKIRQAIDEIVLSLVRLRRC